METEKNSEITNWVTGKGTLNVGSTKLQLEITVPAPPVRPTQMLPVFQSLTNSIVAVAVKEAEAAGEKISCTKGCGACCRQLVPIAKSEAYQLRDLVAELPAPRRTQIQKRFADAITQLKKSGVYEKISAPGNFSVEARQQIGLDYFYQKIACPFLEDESCSIHPDRPLACREYLVTSPAENCASPTAAKVNCVEISGSVSRAVRNLSDDASKRGLNWLPLIFALEWADQNSDQASPATGPEFLGQVFKYLANKTL